MRNGIDTVEISRIEKLLVDLDGEALRRFFSDQELIDAGSGVGRAQKLAARFAAKEAACKLFPKEICLGTIEPYDFSVSRDGYGQPHLVPSERARAVMNRHRTSGISLSMTHTEVSATAIATAESSPMLVPWYGKAVYHLFPLRRKVVMENLRRVFGETVAEPQIVEIAQAFYGHLVKFLLEFLRLPFLSDQKKADLIRIEGSEHLIQAREQGKGVLLLAGHFGNWEVSTVAGMSQYKEYHGLFNFIRRPLKPKWFNDLVMRRFQKAGFGTLDKSGSLDEILDLLERNHIVVSIFDQFTIQKYGIPSEFFGHPAHTFKSLSVLAQFTGAPVIPSSSWREPDGTHVLRFEPPVDVLTEGRTRDIIGKNTKRFNEVLERIILRHPEQWIWMHKRWKKVGE
ncbi:MAG: 4'-phosphopantetheinyl transferase superfamily protein [Verrucomicrobiales bacterium]|jgi:KDO2-lipid IV(A) lauroyltransferase|nr:4'-phosphopantetheinyl transferase superfamily protein [Verrucomicrobiales bacterium]MBP9224723.1 4'-phosphopantetheinyl transferase superfamily protein [Verrucomicrobiales bacterium]